jgi:pimeloyl-ACP methyl ester carboxylesterase
MQTKLLLAVFMVLVLDGLALHPSAGAQDKTTDAELRELWFGVLDAGERRFRFGFELLSEADGMWQGILLSFDEGRQKFVLDSLKRTATDFEFAIKASKGRYVGKFDVSGKRIEGQWLQGSAKLDLVLEQVEEHPTRDVKALWVGDINVLFQKLKVTFCESTDGEVYFESVSQKAGGFVVTKTVQDELIEFDVPGVGGKFSGKLSSDGQEMRGTWKQSLIEVELVLDKSNEVDIRPETPRRPQTPQPPFDYKIHDVDIENPRDKGVSLSATLTIPAGDGPYPAVVLISGSGPQDRDESLLEHKPFWVIADYLTQRGIAVLRYDDRGVGESTGEFASATSLDFASDARAAYEFLRSQDGIDASKVGLCGHSEGGIIAPMVAVADTRVAFVIMLAGPGVNGDQILTSQMELILSASGLEASEIEQQLLIQRKLLDLAELEPPIDESQFSERAGEAIAPLLTDEERETDKGAAIASAAAAQLCTPWFRFFLTHDPTRDLRQLGCPVLVLNGSKDIQVDPNLNVPAIREALAANPESEIVVLPGLNHLFQACDTGNVDEYRSIEETISPDALKIIGDWITDRSN